MESCVDCASGSCIHEGRLVMLSISPDFARRKMTTLAPADPSRPTRRTPHRSRSLERLIPSFLASPPPRLPVNFLCSLSALSPPNHHSTANPPQTQTSLSPPDQVCLAPPPAARLRRIPGNLQPRLQSSATQEGLPNHRRRRRPQRHSTPRPGLRFPLLSPARTGYAVERAPDAQASAVQHVRVEHGRAHVPVPEQLLNRADVVARLEQGGRERMAQRVAPGALRQPGGQHGLAHGALEHGLVQVVPARPRPWCSARAALGEAGAGISRSATLTKLARSGHTSLGSKRTLPSAFGASRTPSEGPHHRSAFGAASSPRQQPAGCASALLRCLGDRRAPPSSTRVSLR